MTATLHEFPELSVDLGESGWSIVRSAVARSTVRAGSADMAREIVRKTGSFAADTFIEGVGLYNTFCQPGFSPMRSKTCVMSGSLCAG